MSEKKRKDNPESLDDITFEADVPADIKFSKFWGKVVKYEFIYSIIGLIIGIIAILYGGILLSRGITGSSDWMTKTFCFESNINDASSGTILFIIGLMIIILSRFRVKVKK